VTAGDLAAGAAAAASSCHAAAGGGGGLVAGTGIFTAGLLGMIMPCTVQMSVVLASILATPGAAAREVPREGWTLRLVSFLSGYAITFLAAAGAASLLVRAAGWLAGAAALQVAGGLILAAFGLQILGWIRLPGSGPCGGPMGFFLGRPYRGAPAPWRMGVSFAMYCAGCCGPAALGAATLLAGGTSPAAAALYLLAYAAGMALPFIALAAGIAWSVAATKRAVRWTPLLSAAGGVVAVASGVLLAMRPLSSLIENL